MLIYYKYTTIGIHEKNPFIVQKHDSTNDF